MLFNWSILGNLTGGTEPLRMSGSCSRFSRFAISMSWSSWSKEKYRSTMHILFDSLTIFHLSFNNIVLLYQFGRMRFIFTKNTDDMKRWRWLRVWFVQWFWMIMDYLTFNLQNFYQKQSYVETRIHFIFFLYDLKVKNYPNVHHMIYLREKQRMLDFFSKLNQCWRRNIDYLA